MTNKFCIVVPHFNHDEQFRNILKEIDATDLPVFIIDDGSSEKSLLAIKAMIAAYPGFMLFQRSSNGGKGAAVVHGVRLARENGFTHVIQLDADGQHCIADTGRLMAESEAHPESLISGLAMFDADVPVSRLYGRKFTLFWTRLETLSDSIKDAMCGFRVYPVKPFLNICDSQKLGRRMEFDVEILVRSIWSGQEVRYVSTRVQYPERGLSHFALIRDNLQISLMHTRLMFGMLIRLPRIIGQKYRAPTS